MPNKTWVVGEEVLAPDFNTYVQQQVIAGFPTVAARTAALAAPVRGQASYVATGDATEGPEYFDGTAWRKPWNQPWGYVSSVVGAAGNIGPLGIADLSGMSIGPMTLPANRRLKVTAAGYGVNQTGAGVSELLIADGGSTRLTSVVVSRAAGDSGSGFCAVLLMNTPATAFLLKLRNNVSGGPTTTYYANTQAQLVFMIEDMGPSGVPT